MPTEPELLQAVLKNPDDDAPRLEYAKWCASQSDEAVRARGDFIGVQLKLAKLGAVPDPRVRFPLLDAASQLETRFRERWDPAIRAITANYIYHRGFIELVELPAASFLAQGEKIYAAAPVRHLNPLDSAGSLPALVDSPLLERIRSLSVARSGWGDAEVTRLAQCLRLPELRWLDLSRNKIGEDGAHALAATRFLPKLAWANFQGNRIQPNEDYSFDNGLVVDAGLPESGRALERRHGPLPWLRHAASSTEDRVPDRFRIAPARLAAA